MFLDDQPFAVDFSQHVRDANRDRMEFSHVPRERLNAVRVRDVAANGHAELADRERRGTLDRREGAFPVIAIALPPDVFARGRDVEDE